MAITIPEKYRAEFDMAADFAVEKEKFTPTELAEHLGTGFLVASIMVGYMEKAELVTPGKNDDVRRARITSEQWKAVEKKIENYVPQPELEMVEEEPESVDLTLEDIITEEIEFIGKTLSFEDGCVQIVGKGSRTQIAPNDILAIYIHKGGLFSKSIFFLSTDGELPAKAHIGDAALCFKKKEYENILRLSERISERLGIDIREF